MTKSLLSRLEDWSGLHCQEDPEVVDLPKVVISKISTAAKAAQAFYDRDENRIYLSTSLSLPRDVVLAHEYMHALIAQSGGVLGDYGTRVENALNEIIDSGKPVTEFRKPMRDLWCHKLLDEGIAACSEEFVSPGRIIYSRHKIREQVKAFEESFRSVCALYSGNDVGPEEKWRAETADELDASCRIPGAAYVGVRLCFEPAQKVIPSLVANPPSLEDIYDRLDLGRISS